MRLGVRRHGNATCLINVLRRALEKHGPLSPHVLVAVSGGQDSLALATALHHLKHTNAVASTISLAHCNHSWPGDDEAAAHVVSFATRMRIPLAVVRGRSVPITEASARDWRYSALCSIADTVGAGDILVAHTRTDLAETALLNIAAGAGADGVGAMRPVRPLSDRHRLLRPLLQVSRKDTADFCREHSVSVWNDPYNEANFARNRVRARVIPMLEKELNPKVERSLARNAVLLRDDADALELIATDVFESAVQIEHNRITVRRHVLLGYHLAIQRRVFRRVLALIAREGAHPCSFAHVEALCNLLVATPGTRSASLQGGAEARVDEDDCIVLQGGYIQQHLFADDTPENARQSLLEDHG